MPSDATIAISSGGLRRIIPFFFPWVCIPTLCKPFDEICHFRFNALTLSVTTTVSSPLRESTHLILVGRAGHSTLRATVNNLCMQKYHKHLPPHRTAKHINNNMYQHPGEAMPRENKQTGETRLSILLILIILCSGVGAGRRWAGRGRGI